MISPYLWAALVALVALSAFFSATEMAYSSANRMRLEAAAENGVKAAAAACRIYDEYEKMLSTNLICNELVNIAASSVVTVIAIQLFAGADENLATTLGTILIAIVIIIFGDTIPKIVAKKNANAMSIRHAYVLRALMTLFYPLVWLVVNIIHLLTKDLKGEESDEEDDAVEELGSIIDTVEDEGVIDEDRSELLHAALDFYDVSVSEVMTSRVDMLAIDIDDDWEEILQTIDSSTYSRLPVYEDSVDNIIGVLYLNHFFKALTSSEPMDLRPLLIKPCYVYKTVKLPAVMAEMRRSKTHLAIVTDEYGGSMGIVTMEDVLEELVGDIWDETDDVEPEMIEHGNNVYELDGDMTMSDFLELIDRSEDSFETDSATVGGWTIEKFGRFPRCWDSFKYDNLTITVLEVVGQRVEKVLLSIDRKDKEKKED